MRKLNPNRCLISALALLTVANILPSRAFAQAAPPAGAKTLPLTRSSGSKQAAGTAQSSGAKQIGQPATVGDKWAVVIGIADFADANVPKLKYCAKDAKDFSDFLVDPNGGKFQPDHVKVLLNADATKVNIMDVLGDSFLPHAAAPGDLVVIYLSTHGSPAGADIRGVNYVVAYDTQVKKLFATGIEMQQLLRMIKERVHTNRILLVMDTCYSGASAQGDHKGLTRTNVDTQKVAQGIGSVVISSSSSDQRAWESDELQNSYFTRYLIEALKSNNGGATVDQAFSNMKQKVQAAVLKDKGDIQTPVMGGAFSGGSICLAAPVSSPHAAPVTLSYSSSEADVAPGSRSTGNGAIDLTEYTSHMREANKLIDDHKLWDAVHELQMATKANPESIEGYLVTADVFDQQGRYNEAIEAARRAVLNDQNSSRARQLLGLCYLRCGAPDDAMRQTQMAITLDPSNSMAHNLLGFIDQHKLSKVDEAEQAYRKSLELNALNVRALVNLGLLLESENKNLDEAQSLFKKAIDADSDDWEAHMALGHFLYTCKNNYKDAESEMRKAIALAPANWQLHSELGLILANDKNRHPDAEAQLRKGIELAPDKGQPHAMLAAFLLNPLNRVDEAEKEFRKAIEFDPNLDSARVGLGTLLVDNKKVFDESDDQFRKALKSNPRNALAYIGLAKIDRQLYKDYAKAEQDLRKALVIEPNNALAYDQLGLLLAECSNRPIEAKQAFEKAIALDPLNALPHYHLGQLYLRDLKDNDQAVAQLNKAIELDPTSSDYQTALGNTLSQLKKYKEAEAAYRKAIELNMQAAEAHCRLGLLLIEKLGRRASGETELQRARELDGNDKTIKYAFERYVR